MFEFGLELPTHESTIQQFANAQRKRHSGSRRKRMDQSKTEERVSRNALIPSSPLDSLDPILLHVLQRRSIPVDFHGYITSSVKLRSNAKEQNLA